LSDKEKIKARLPNIPSEKVEELSDEQASFIVLPMNQSVYLKACPGSGKTEVVGLKSAYEIADWKEKFSGLAVLSFTRNAAKEIADRVSKYSGINSTKHPHFVGTIDSWLHRFVLHPFGHKVVKYQGKNSDNSFRLVDNNSHYDFLIPFNTKNILQRPIFVNEFYFECDKELTIQSQSKYFSCKELTREQIKQLLYNKKLFLKAGLATYSDAEFLCYYVLLKNDNILNNIVKRFPVILIDECQDLSFNQLQIFQLLLNKGTKLFFIGDLNQAIYEFRKVYTENIEFFISENSFLLRNLPRNFRSNQNIVDVCQNLEKNIGFGKTILKIEGNKNLNENYIILEEYENIEEIPQIFLNIIELYNINCDEHYQVDFKKSVILGRGHSLLAKIRPDQNNKTDKIELFANALICWNAPNRNGKDIQNALQQLGKSISILAFAGFGNHQQQYCPEGVTQLEWRGFLYRIIAIASNLIYPFGEVTWSEWIKGHLKPFLKTNWDNWFNGILKWEDTASSVRSPSGKKDNKIIEDMDRVVSENSDKIRITTIHDVKGETFDAVMLVSSKDKQSKGGHYEHWISDLPENSEFVRFAYVASSRPKHLLIWAIPTIKKDKENILQKLNQILNIKD
jgi:DNA helicase II / ATP-dependent DNA helicase PcrA